MVSDATLRTALREVHDLGFRMANLLNDIARVSSLAEGVVPVVMRHHAERIAREFTVYAEANEQALAVSRGYVRK
jgi:hypothetical protein